MTSGQRVNTYLCMTKDVGLGGNLFGGVMMGWIDESAAIFAYKYTGATRLVTLKFAEMVFRLPVRVGDFVDVYAANIRTGRTSITLDVECRVGDKVVVETTATFVSLDEAGRPTPIVPKPD
ncbi:MAG: acyl-CoA thioesterase [Candidatus Hydrogenedentes bacterium]|nr:acyl-CoA thioesterase [Candidatus Hydrogenedentota bacterium]